MKVMKVSTGILKDFSSSRSYSNTPIINNDGLLLRSFTRFLRPSSKSNPVVTIPGRRCTWWLLGGAFQNTLRSWRCRYPICWHPPSPVSVQQKDMNVPRKFEETHTHVNKGINAKFILLLRALPGWHWRQSVGWWRGQGWGCGWPS